MPTVLIAAQNAQTRISLLPAHIETMLDAAEPVMGSHALVIGTATIDVLCGLIARGCGAAQERKPDSSLSVEPAELVLVPHVEDLSAALAAIAMARRCLLPCGRLILFATDHHLGADLVRLLRSSGFSGLRTHASAEGQVISADWPMFGLNRALRHA